MIRGGRDPTWGPMVAATAAQGFHTSTSSAARGQRFRRIMHWRGGQACGIDRKSRRGKQRFKKRMGCGVCVCRGGELTHPPRPRALVNSSLEEFRVSDRFRIEGIEGMEGIEAICAQEGASNRLPLPLLIPTYSRLFLFFLLLQNLRLQSAAAWYVLEKLFLLDSPSFSKRGREERV